MVDKSDRFHLDPDKVRKVELCHQPPGGRERVRVTVEYVSGEVKVLTATSSCLRLCLRSSTLGRGNSNAGTPTSENSCSTHLDE
jgi:hypothetical protein